MYLYKSSLGLQISTLQNALVAVYGRDHVIIPYRNEPAWKTAQWIADAIDTEDPLATLHEKALIASGTSIFGHTICPRPNATRQETRSVDFLHYMRGYMIDATEGLR